MLILPSSCYTFPCKFVTIESDWDNKFYLIMLSILIKRSYTSITSVWSLRVNLAFFFQHLYTYHSHLYLFAVELYDIHKFTVVQSSLHMLIMNQYNNQLPISLLAQLVEHCTGIAEVMGLTPLQAWIFSGFIFIAAYYKHCSLLWTSLSSLLAHPFKEVISVHFSGYCFRSKVCETKYYWSSQEWYVHSHLCAP